MKDNLTSDELKVIESLNTTVGRYRLAVPAKLCKKRLTGKTVSTNWYDNEWVYSNRGLDLILMMESQKPL